MLQFSNIDIERNGERRTIYSSPFLCDPKDYPKAPALPLAQQMGTSVEMLEKFYGHVVTADVADRISK